MNHLIKAILAAFLLLYTSPAFAAAQQSISIEHQYLHLLRWQNHLDKVAAEREKQGKDGAWLRNALRNQLHFTDAQFAPIRESAQRLDASLQIIDAKAKPFLDSYHQKHLTTTASAADRASLHSQLEPIRSERKNAMTAEIATLNQNLGADAAGKLRHFIDQQFSKSASAQAQAKTSQGNQP